MTAATVVTSEKVVMVETVVTDWTVETVVMVDIFVTAVHVIAEMFVPIEIMISGVVYYNRVMDSILSLDIKLKCGVRVLDSFVRSYMAAFYPIHGQIVYEIIKFEIRIQNYFEN